MPTEFTTPLGRIVWGNPAKPVNKKDKNKQPIIRDGQQVQQWVCGIAFPKAEFEQLVMPYLQQEVASVFTHGVPANFSWKIKDGDGVDNQGKSFADREGYAGNYILTVSTEAYAPEIYKHENGAYRQIEPNEIKCGDYVVTSLMIKANQPSDATHTPGIFVNPKGFVLAGYGSEIVGSSANPDEMFGGATYQLPPGASATPIAPTPVANPSPAAIPAASVPIGGVAGVMISPSSPAPLPPPAHDFVQNAAQPPTAPAPPAAVPGLPQGR